MLAGTVLLSTGVNFLKFIVSNLVLIIILIKRWLQYRQQRKPFDESNRIQKKYAINVEEEFKKDRNIDILRPSGIKRDHDA